MLRERSSTPLLKEPLEQRRGFGFRQAAVDLRPMMAASGGKELHAVIDCSPLGVSGPVVKPANARKRDGARAHRTRLERDVEIAIHQPLGAERRAGGAHRNDLGMRGRVVVGERAVAGTGDDSAVVHNDAADRNLAARARRARFLQRLVHE
jgi:hypothetical protein